MMTPIIHGVLLVFLVILGCAIVRLENLFPAVMLTAILSLVAASLYVGMDAVDVAFTEAAVGAGIATLLFLGTIALTTQHGQEETAQQFSLSALAIVTVTGLALMVGVSDIPAPGDGGAPVHQHLADRYIKQSPQEIGIPNMVTSVLASYRGYDTMGEVAVIFTAGIGVLLLLGVGGHRKGKPARGTPPRS